MTADIPVAAPQSLSPNDETSTDHTSVKKSTALIITEEAVSNRSSLDEEIDNQILSSDPEEEEESKMGKGSRRKAKSKPLPKVLSGLPSESQLP